MLLPVDLMSLAGAGSSSGYARDGANSATSTAPSWLLTADMDMSPESGNDLINQIFLSYTSDGEADPAARFAADLQALLQAHGASLTADGALASEPISLAAELQGLETADSAWSVDELLQMSMNPLAGGNNLPLSDETLPVVLSNWLAALTNSAENTAVNAESSPPGTNPHAALLTGNQATTSESATVSTLTGTMNLATPGGAPDSLTSAATDRLTGVSPTGVAGDPGAADAAPKTTDADPLTSDLPTRLAGSATPGTDQDMAVRTALVDDAARRAAEAAQVNPGSQKVSADAANASAFRSIQFNAQANGEMTATADGMPGSQPEPGKTGALQERTQALAGQWTAALTSAASEAPASSSSAQLFSATDGSALLNRAEQRMFATEAAQQAQSQASQQTATRTADGLPRFAMDTAFGQQGWSDSLGRQLLVMNSQGITSAQIRLDPPELGSLTVKIQMAADQQASVSFVSQHAVVRDALEQQLNRLQDLFRDQGLNLQDVSVSDQSPQQREGQEQGQQQGRGRDTGPGEHDPKAAEPVLVRSESLIDFYA